MGVKVSLWGGFIASSPLDLAAVPAIGDLVVLNKIGYPVLAIAYGLEEAVFARVGKGEPFNG